MQICGRFRGGLQGPVNTPPPLVSILFHFHGEFLENIGKMVKSTPHQQIWTHCPKILDPPLQIVSIGVSLHKMSKPDF